MANTFLEMGQTIIMSEKAPTLTSKCFPTIHCLMYYLIIHRV